MTLSGRLLAGHFAGLATAGQTTTTTRGGGGGGGGGGEAEAGNERWLNEKRSKLCAKHLRIHHGDQLELGQVEQPGDQQ